MAAVDLWSLENPVFSLYVLCSAILLLKTVVMSPFTAFKRVTLKSFPLPEDYVYAGMKAEVKPSNPAVERVRRAHLNDMENILPFIFIGLFYILTNPSLGVAKLYFAIFTVFRVAHTMIFLHAIGQPARFLVFLIANLVNTAMAISVIVHVLPLCLAGISSSQ